MAEFQKLDNEQVIASITSKTSSIFLTNLRVFQQNTNGSQKNSSIIPINNIDSFGLIKAESKLMLFLAILLLILGGLSLVASSDTSIGVGLLFTGIFFLISWQFSKKTGIAIYSLSGKTEIFLQATGKNQHELLGFVQSIQNWLFLKNASTSTITS